MLGKFTLNGFFTAKSQKSQRDAEGKDPADLSDFLGDEGKSSTQSGRGRGEGREIVLKQIVCPSRDSLLNQRRCGKRFNPVECGKVQGPEWLGW